MVCREELHVAAEAVVNFEHDKAHAYCIDHLVSKQQALATILPRSPPPFPKWKSAIISRNTHLGKTDNRIIPAKVVCDPYPRNQSQTHKYSCRTKDSPVDGNEHRAKISVARRGYYLCMVHFSGNSAQLRNTASCECSRRTIIAWEFV